MRLINTSTNECEEFIGQNIPKYAILSHTWGQEEVSYKEFKRRENLHKKGYQKIAMSCQVAAQAGLKYIWVDTCCINKSSSAELSEAINSMYNWYKRSTTCFVFLEDLLARTVTERMGACRWFSRCWTLQELIAPLEVHLYDQQWHYRGSKKDHVSLIRSITNIPEEVLMHQHSLATLSVAQRMSWAAHRQTTRIEDIAYSLLGIFGVNMPLLYGEEYKAFRRLQEIILSVTSDLSIFAWSIPTTSMAVSLTPERVICGLLAESPDAFARSHIIAFSASVEMSSTGMGIRTRARLYGTAKDSGPSVLQVGQTRSGQHLWVRLRKCGLDQYARSDPFSLLVYEGDVYPEVCRELYLVTELLNDGKGVCHLVNGDEYLLQMRSNILQIRCGPEFVLFDQWDVKQFDEENQLFFIRNSGDRDAGFARLKIGSPGLDGYDLRFTFFGVRWSNQNFQYTLVEDSAYSTALMEIRYDLQRSDTNSSNAVAVDLRRGGIGRKSTLAIKLARTAKTALIKCEASREKDFNLCLNPFWRVTFSLRIVDDEQVPEIPEERWLVQEVITG